MKRVTIVIAVILAGLLLLPAVVLADNIQFNGWQQPGLKIKGYVDWHRVYANTGEFDITWDEQAVLAAYCTNILEQGVGGSYSVASLSDFDPGLNNNLYRAAWIMENYTPGLGYESSYYNDTVAATAVQSAIWALLTPYHHSPFGLYSVQSGSYTERYRAKQLYSQVLAESAGIDFNSYAFQNIFHFATSQQHKQDLLFATQGGAAVPEPGSLLLVGSALLGAWGYRFRSRKRRS